LAIYTYGIGAGGQVKDYQRRKSGNPHCGQGFKIIAPQPSPDTQLNTCIILELLGNRRKLF